ncbi:Acetyltransferase (GNAT) domain-containing protein [Filomicrobium insigne]|uniref:Acetyltransferase (GNAT) domain-containing protein n=2 Tax=Filomicrobium insigne TaxID=418854 RepID=A0A1H0GY88_9HYPH|nr:Acetyltransferase (GNAT) domain-containing protein [Filomicrobium insigne]
MAEILGTLMLNRLRGAEDLLSEPAVEAEVDGYRAERVLDEYVWEDLLARHPLRSAYTSWGWGEYKRGSGWNVERFRVVDAAGVTRALYQTQTQKRCGIRRVLIQGGPLFFDCETYSKISKIVEVMLKQIDVRWNVVVGINFYGFRTDETVMGILASGFAPILNRRNFTLVMDLSKGLDDVRAQLNQTARRYVKLGLKNPKLSCDIVRGARERRAAIDRLAAMYDDLATRKNFEKGFNTSAFRKIVGDDDRYVIAEAHVDGEVASLYIAHQAAKRMIGLVAASNELARANEASYLAIWTLFEYACSEGLTSFDLSGIDPFGNYGTFQFKRRISRKLEQSDPLWLYCKNPVLRNAVTLALTRS